MHQIAEADNGREVTLAMGEMAELTLAENPTTGYQWELNAKAETVCKLVKDEFEPSGGATGSGGIHRWRFKAVKPGSGEIELQYRRPWEKNAAPARTFQARVRVHK